MAHLLFYEQALYELSWHFFISDIAVLILMLCDSYSVEPDRSARYDNSNLSISFVQLSACVYVCYLYFHFLFDLEICY